MAKELKYGSEARKALEAGVDKLADTCFHYIILSKCSRIYTFG